MLGCVAALFVCACGEGPPPPRSPVTASTSKEAATPPSAARPRVVIAIVIDQFAAWIAADRLKELPSMGGFARLQAEGAYYRDMRFEHAVTDTAPGHAALFSGSDASRLRHLFQRTHRSNYQGACLDCQGRGGDAYWRKGGGRQRGSFAEGHARRNHCRQTSSSKAKCLDFKHLPQRSRCSVWGRKKS